MRYILAVAFLYATATASFAEEAYLLTAQAFGTCLGTQMRFRYDPPERIAEVIKQKCGNPCASMGLKGNGEELETRNLESATR